jgi:hypothetical protein
LGGGWGGTTYGSKGQGGDGGSVTVKIGDTLMNYKSSNEKHSYFSGDGGIGGDNGAPNCVYDGGGGASGSSGSVTVTYNVSTMFSLVTHNLTFGTSSNNKIYLNDPIMDYFGMFNGSDIDQITSIYCSAPNITIGNDSALDPQLSWINCPAYTTGNITYVDYYNFFDLLANESSARVAIELGINSSALTSYSLFTDQQLYVRYLNNTQMKGKFDKVVLSGNQTWAFNYITGNESFTNITGLSNNTLVIWESQSLTSEQITQQVETLINQTKW